MVSRASSSDGGYRSITLLGNDNIVDNDNYFAWSGKVELGLDATGLWTLVSSQRIKPTVPAAPRNSNNTVSCHKHSCAYTMPIRRSTHVMETYGAFRQLQNACLITKPLFDYKTHI